MTATISFDYMMKNLLRDKANFVVLNGLLSELLKKEVVAQEILESESNPESELGKFNRLGLKAKINAGEIFPEYYLIYPKHFNEEIQDKFDEWVYFLKVTGLAVSEIEGL